MTAWLRPLRADARVRLFCFPYAGGGSAEFARWRLVLPAEVEVSPVLLPGRESRLSEAPWRDPDALVTTLADALGSALDRPYALFGHSVGAAIAFAVARELLRRGHPAPAHLFLSGRAPPDAPRDEPPLHTLSEDTFLALLGRRYDAIPAALLADRELLSLFLPALRADMELSERITLPTDPPVPVPTTLFVGRDDSAAPPPLAAGWSRWLTRPPTIELLDGGHFFLKGPNRVLLATIARTLGL